MTKKSKKQKPGWKDVVTIINRYDKKQLIDLVSDIYRLSSDNKDFFHTRFSLIEDPLVPYKEIIQEAIHPCLEDNESLDIEKANNAINLYSKSVDNPRGLAELMTFYVECGNNFTLSYGDIDEEFYDSVLEMYEYAVETVKELPVDEQNEFRDRLHSVMKSASGIGWGYYDGLCDLFFNAFSNNI